MSWKTYLREGVGEFELVDPHSSRSNIEGTFRNIRELIKKAKVDDVTKHDKETMKIIKSAIKDSDKIYIIIDPYAEEMSGKKIIWARDTEGDVEDIHSELKGDI